MPKVRLLARGVLRSGRFLLLAHNKAKAHTFLPGGRIEPGEPARAALAREFREEMGLKVRVGEFLGTVEHTWQEQGQRRHELNLIFEVTARRTDHRKPVPSREEHLEFPWCAFSRLAAAGLQPAPLRKWLPRALQSGGPLWASTLGGRKAKRSAQSRHAAVG